MDLYFFFSSVFFSEIELAYDESLALPAIRLLVCGTVPHYSLQLALDPFFASYLQEQPRVSQLLYIRSFSTIFCTLMIWLYDMTRSHSRVETLLGSKVDNPGSVWVRPSCRSRMNVKTWI